MSVLSKKLESVKKTYNGMSTNGYDSRWYNTGCRRVGEVSIVDDDFELESFFLNCVVNVQKSVRLEGVDIHTRIINMTLFDSISGENITLDYTQLMELKAKQEGEE